MLQTIEQGSGPAVLLIHGAGPDASTWQDVIDDLAGDHRVVAYNRRGYPGSGEPVREWDTHIDDAVSVIEANGLAPVTVVGHSAGSIVAAGVAARRPDLVARLILFDPIVHAQKRPTFRLIRTVMKVQRLRKRDPEQATEIFFRWATAYSDGGGSAFDTLSPDDQATMKQRHAAVFADMDAGDGSKQLKRAALSELRNVTIAVADRTDPWFVKSSKALAKAVPGARTVSVEGAGHAVSLDQPSRVAEIIRAASH